MDLTHLLQIILILFILVIPIAWKYSQTFRYYAKTTLYYCSVYFVGNMGAFTSLPWPRDVTNWRVMQWMFIFITDPFNIKWEKRNRKYLDVDQSVVVICNHQSSLDLIGMMQMWPERCVPMIKGELKYFGLFGLSGYLNGTVFIDRYDRHSAREAMAKTVDFIKKNNAKIWMFPEGTRNRNGTMLPFKKGAFHLAVQAGIPIVPVVFSNYAPFYSKKQKKFLPEGFVIAEALPPVSVEGKTADDVNEIAETTRENMLAVFERISAEAIGRYEKDEF